MRSRSIGPAAARSFAALPLLALLFFCGGCGYRIGMLGHPQIKTIAIAPVTNETTSYNAAAQARNILSEVFVADGTLKLTHLSDADCILYAKVKNVAFSEASWSSNNDDQFVPNQWNVSVTLEYSVIQPGQAQPLAQGAVSGGAQFMTGPDMEIGRLNGIRQALLSASKSIVIALTEGW